MVLRGGPGKERCFETWLGQDRRSWSGGAGLGVIRFGMSSLAARKGGVCRVVDWCVTEWRSWFGMSSRCLANRRLAGRVLAVMTARVWEVQEWLVGAVADRHGWLSQGEAGRDEAV